MLKFTNNDGFIYFDETTGKEFSLFDTSSLGGQTTPDIIVIFDHAEHKVVNYFYGSTHCMDGHKALRELDESVKRYVDEYTSRDLNPATIKYPFDENGVKRFMSDAYDDIFKAMESCNPMTDYYGDHDIYIRINGREIRIPDLAGCYELLDTYLKDSAEEAFS
jgi:hypothetical protein